MLEITGVVTKNGMEKWTNEETGETGESFRFAIEGLGMIPDDAVNRAELPPVGQKTTVMVNRLWSSRKKREFFFVLGVVPNAVAAGTVH